MTEDNDQKGILTIEKTLKYISLGSVLFLIGGIIYNIAYFSAFNIDILDYIDLSESLALFIPRSIAIILTSIVLAPLTSFFVSYLFIWDNKNRRPTPLKPTYLFDQIALTVIMLFVSAIMYVLRKHFDRDTPYKEILLMMVLMWIVWSILLAVAWSRKHSPGTLTDYKLHLLIYCVVLVGFSILVCLRQITIVKNRLGNVEVKLTINDTLKVKTDSVTAFVGQTKSYFFLYNIRAKTTTVIPKTRVTQIEFIELP